MALELHSWPRSSGTRVSWALEELNVAYKYIEVDQKSLEHRSSKYLALNPHGKVPTLVDGEQVFFESAAILLHLGDKYGAGKGLWPAANDPAHCEALCWTVWSMTELGGYMMQYLYHGLDTPFSYKPEDRSKACAEYNHAQFLRCVNALESRLGDRQYLLRDFSLVDIAATSWLSLGAMCGLALAAQPRVVAWTQRCVERAACKRAR